MNQSEESAEFEHLLKAYKKLESVAYLTREQVTSGVLQPLAWYGDKASLAFLPLTSVDEEFNGIKFTFSKNDKTCTLFISQQSFHMLVQLLADSTA